MFVVVLSRGCDKEALNFAGQTPYQVAVIAGNLELAEVIQKHKPEDVGKELSLCCFVKGLVFIYGL